MGGLFISFDVFALVDLMLIVMVLVNSWVDLSDIDGFKALFLSVM